MPLVHLATDYPLNSPKRVQPEKTEEKQMEESQEEEGQETEGEGQESEGEGQETEGEGQEMEGEGQEVEGEEQEVKGEEQEVEGEEVERLQDAMAMIYSTKLKLLKNTWAEGLPLNPESQGGSRDSKERIDGLYVIKRKESISADRVTFFGVYVSISHLSTRETKQWGSSYTQSMTWSSVFLS